MMLLLLFLLLFARNVEPYVYSCEEVLFHLMNSTFEQYAKYAAVIAEEGFLDKKQLGNIYLQNGEDQYSFAEIANTGRKYGEGQPWRVYGIDPTMKCSQEFTLIFKSDERPILSFPKHQIARYKFFSGVFVTPQNGMWIYKHAITGEGSVTVYTGAGSGEDEQRYLLQSWRCDSMPDWIWSFDNVITIDIDPKCSFMLSCSTDIVSSMHVYRYDRIAILSSGRSDNAQNRQGTEPEKAVDLRAKITIGNFEESLVDVQMQLNFDSENTGSLEIQKHFGGLHLYPYYNDSNCYQFSSSYFEVRWNPTPIDAEYISRNEDNIYVDIQIFDPDPDQPLCYKIVWPLPPINGFNFTEAEKACYSAGDTLPILTSKQTDEAVESFAQMYLAWGNYWIGIECNTENNTLMWQDGQPVDYNAFPDDTSPTICTGAETFAYVNKDDIWSEYSPEEEFQFVLCAKGPEYSTTSPDPSTTITSTESFDTTEHGTHMHSSTDLSSSQPVLSTSIPSSTTMTDTTTSTLPTTLTTTGTITLPTTTTNPNNGSTFPLWAIILIALCILACFIGGFVFARRKISVLRARVVEEQMDKEKKLNYNGQKTKKRRYYGHPGANHDWEIERTFVGIDYLSKLGEGAFGSVYLGRVLAKNIPSVVGRSIIELSALTNEQNTVAVKMLHENADAQKEREFRSEIDLMQKIGFHERIVNMLACVTYSDPILLICEYCAKGDLLEFLRTKRKFMLENPDDTDEARVITVEKQLMFAIQIAYGMEYLSSCGFIHRDLAARNILLDHQESCKIGDFGLARSLGEENENYHAQGGKLPLKWMSPEAIEKYLFSSSSDVWSFGVLLFEIVTLGGSPYSGWPVPELLSRLKGGERMEQPDNCSDDLYEVMRACWSEHPSDRPEFTELRKLLGDLLEDVNKDDYYLKLNADANYYVLESNASD